MTGVPTSPDAANAEIVLLRQALSAAEARERVLADELQHRLRNLLAMIRSVIRQSWEFGASQEDYVRHLQGRLDAITRYQTRLGGGRAPGIDLEDMLRDELLQTLCLDGPRCSISGPPVRLVDKQAELIGLAIHELATNAIKFGAFAQDGSLTVAWSVVEGELRFRWSETGVAVASPAPRPSGFGRQLIEAALPYELGASTSFQFRPGGMTATILLVLPMDEARSHSGSQADEEPLLSDGLEEQL